MSSERLLLKCKNIFVKVRGKMRICRLILMK